MFEALKKTIGLCLVGIGTGILLVLLLPVTGWLFLIGCALFILGNKLGYFVKNKRKDMIV